VSPESSADFTGRAGGPFSPNRQTYTLTNNGGAPITWRVSKNSSWLGISATSGKLEPGASVGVTLSIVNRETRNLAVGTYTDTVTFENLDNGAGATTRQVNLTITRR
jgi:hypothetical protein